MQESCGRTLRATPRPEGPYAARSPALDFLNVVERGTAAAEDGPAAWRAGWLGFRRDRHVCACRSGQGKTQREIRRCFTRTVARQLYRCWSAGGQSTRREPYVLPRRRQRLNGGGGSGQADRVPADLCSAVLGCSMQQPGRRAARVVVGGTLVVLVALVVAGRMLSGGLQPPAARPTPGNHGADRQLAPHHRTRGRCGGDHPGRAEPTQIAVGAGGVWVGVWATGRLVCIDPASNRVVARIPVGRPQESPIAIAADARAVWVVDFGDARVLRIDPVTNRVVARIPVRGVGGPPAVQVDPGRGRARRCGAAVVGWCGPSGHPAWKACGTRSCDGEDGSRQP
jgi:hypothetical protein